MSLQQTAITLAPTWKEKGLRVTGGSPAVHEKVAVTLSGAAQDSGGGVYVAPEGLAVRIFPVSGRLSGTAEAACHPVAVSRQHAFDYARFPLAATDAWTVDGQDLKCVIDLDRDNLIREFHGAPADHLIEAFVTVESGGADNLYACGRIMIRNWIVDAGDPVPGSSVLKQRVDDLEEGLSDHAHTGADGSVKTDHVNLLNKGVRTHAEIDGLFGTVAGKAEGNDLTAEAVARYNADAALDTRVEDIELAMPGKSDKPAQQVLDAISDLEILPVLFTENHMRQKLNELVAIVKGLYP